MTIPTTIPAVGRWSVQGRELLGSVGPTWQAADDHLRGDVMADPGRPQPPRDQPRRRPVRPPRPTRLMQAALDAAAAGLYVFPVSPKGKLPAIKEWEDAATRDPQLIEEWWSARPWNLGLAVGRSNVLVVDLDPHRGAEPPVEFPGARGGADVLARLAAEAGQPDPVDTYTVTTPSVIHGGYGRSQPRQGRGLRGGPELVVAGLSAGRQRRGALAGRSSWRRSGGSR